MSISIIIPTFSRPKLLKKALESVVKSKDVKDFEIIVIDDSVDDSSAKNSKICKEFQPNCDIRYIKNKENKGANYCRNLGAKMSKKKYLAFLDDDDEFESCKLHYQLNTIQRENVVAVYCGVSLVFKEVLLTEITPSDEGDLTRKILFHENGLNAGSTLMIEKDVFLDIGGFDESLPRMQDWDFLINFFQKGYKISCLSIPLSKINTDFHFSTRSPEKTAIAVLYILSKYDKLLKSFSLQDRKKIKRINFRLVAVLFAAKLDVVNSLIWIKKAYGLHFYLKPRAYYILFSALNNRYQLKMRILYLYKLMLVFFKKRFCFGNS